jgi:hypothetical protein
MLRLTATSALLLMASSGCGMRSSRTPPGQAVGSRSDPHYFEPLKTEDDDDDEEPAAAVSSGRRTFYADSEHGDDSRSGMSAATSWRSLQRINQAKLQGGDAVLLRRGCVWRGAPLLGQSGDSENGTVRFGAWGDTSMPKPQLLGSVSAGHASDWTARRAGLWEANLTDLWARAGGATAQITDVGNIILGHPNAMLHAATKVWAASELTASAEFFYNFTFSNREVPDNAGSLLFFSPEGNPATVFGGVEVALMTRWHAMIINKGVSHVVYEDLDIRYTGGDGML